MRDEWINVDVGELDVNDMNAPAFKGMLGLVRPLEFAGVVGGTARLALPSPSEPILHRHISHNNRHPMRSEC